MNTSDSPSTMDPHYHHHHQHHQHDHGDMMTMMENKSSSILSMPTSAMPTAHSMHMAHGHNHGGDDYPMLVRFDIPNIECTCWSIYWLLIYIYLFSSFMLDVHAWRLSRNSGFQLVAHRDSARSSRHMFRARISGHLVRGLADMARSSRPCCQRETQVWILVLIQLFCF